MVTRVRAGLLRQAMFASLAGERLEVHIQRELKSPNRTLWAHWRVKSREKREWRAAMVNAFISSLGVPMARQMLTAKSGLVVDPGPRCERRMRVSIERRCPSTRNFIRDDDNLLFSTKHIVDALRDLGLIRDDDRQWCERPLPTQVVSPDGTFWTVIVVEPV